MEKLTKLGITSLSVMALGAVAPLVVPDVFGANVVYAEEQAATYRVHYVISGEGTDIIPPKENSLKPGESVVETAIEIPGYAVDENDGPSSVDVNHDIITGKEWSVFFGKDPDGVARTGFGYKKVETPADQPTNPVQPETPAEQPQTPPEVPAVKPETPAEKPTEEPAKPTQPETPANKPAEEPQKPADKPVEPEKPEVPATKPETPAKPTDKPADQQPLKYRVTWYMGGKVYRTYEWEIEPGETFNKGYYDKGTVPTYGPVDGTPLSHNISYDDVKAGKTNYDFYIYDLKTQNSDGTPKTEVPANKPETPADKPSDKPVEQPITPVKPTEKPASKPTDTNKPVVKPADNGKPEVKTENKVEPKAEMQPTQQSGNAAANAQTPAPKADTKAPAADAPKADKPAEKKMETLPNTGESQSTLALLGLALGVLGLQGLTYKGRHDRKR